MQSTTGICKFSLSARINSISKQQGLNLRSGSGPYSLQSRIRVTREIEDKEKDSWLGNWVENYKYRIALNNYSDRKVKLRLMFRMPYIEDEGLGISDLKTNVALSDNNEYIRSTKAKGILRWDLALEPDIFDDMATVVNYEYTIKYDNDIHISTVGS